MIGVGIDVSKLKSTICITNEYGEVLKAPYEISHTEMDLKELTKQIKGYGGKNDVRVVMEATGSYSRPVLYYLLDEGIFVSEINPLAMKKYRADINFRGVKNDSIDAMAIAQYTIEKWNKLKEYQRADKEYAADVSCGFACTPALNIALKQICRGKTHERDYSARNR